MDEVRSERLRSEEAFHDHWAVGEDVASIDVRAMNEACTAPEMRFIRKILGDLRGKTLLDVGCGLGEASVYFAMEGAEVTALDLSHEMLQATTRLARQNGVTVSTYKSAAEDLDLGQLSVFDVVYAGNLLHHVDTEATLEHLARCVKPGGVFISWDPLAYNPLINVYRRIARNVRTHDEHPLRFNDLRLFRRHFEEVQTRWFWLTTLTIFLGMVFVQRRDPRKERFWKKVVEEGNRWAWLYTPLERVDRVLLSVLPFLRPLCWNVVVVARGPRRVR
jgi:2-polyprenyl-3-methyl-5-hydroxy-6-metoxy-1,4-benzoquinol methylase